MSSGRDVALTLQCAAEHIDDPTAAVVCQQSTNTAIHSTLTFQFNDLRGTFQGLSRDLGGVCMAVHAS